MARGGGVVRQAGRRGKALWSVESHRGGIVEPQSRARRATTSSVGETGGGLQGNAKNKVKLEALLKAEDETEARSHSSL